MEEPKTTHQAEVQGPPGEASGSAARTGTGGIDTPAEGSSHPPHDLDLARLWVEVRESLAASLPESTFRMWIAPIRPVAERDAILFFRGPESVREWVSRRYQGLIREAFGSRGFEVSGISFDEASTEGARSRSGRIVQPNPTHTFDRFVIGRGNHLAHSAALAVAEAPAEAYNPLFLHGPPGLGKTHLMGAVAQYLARNRPDLTVLFTNAESFTSEFIEVLRADGSADLFRQRYRSVDVLLVDDVQFLAGKKRTEEEFFHTFNTLHEAGAQLVLSADTDPSGIDGMAARLSDRFEWGLSVQLESPDLATRLTVLRQLIDEAGIELPDSEVVRLIASSVTANLRQLRGALTRIVAEASLAGSEVSRELVTRVVSSGSGPLQTGGLEVTPRQVRERASSYFAIPVDSLTSRRRDRKTVQARSVAMFVTREVCGSTLSEIGSLYGDRDHSTVLAAVRRVEESEGVDPDVTRLLTGFRAAISG
ncbi:MAG: chromosomal replication initiator protein DnaA [Solirubrobacterales bacterium]